MVAGPTPKVDTWENRISKQCGASISSIPFLSPSVHGLSSPPPPQLSWSLCRTSVGAELTAVHGHIDALAVQLPLLTASLTTSVPITVTLLDALSHCAAHLLTPAGCAKLLSDGLLHASFIST